MRFSWEIRSIYLYLVSLVTLIMIIIGTVQLIQTVVDFVYPPPTYYPGPVELKNRYQMQGVELSPQAIEEQARIERENAWRSQRYYSVKRLANSLALLVVAGPLYIYHWRKAQAKGNGE